MENIRKHCLKIEQALNNLLEATIIKNDYNAKLVDKYPKLLAIHKYSDEFYDDYDMVKEYILSNNKNKEMLQKLSETVKSINSLFYMRESIIGRKKYFKQYFEENPNKAVKIIIDFINDDKEDNISAYLYSHSILKDEFTMALAIVEQKDKYIYDQYISKMKDLEESKYDRACNNLKEIARGIETGYLSDGTEFDELQFWKLAPFKYSEGIVNDFKKFRQINPNIGSIGMDNFFRRIKAFAMATMPDKAQIILDYMRKNNFYSYTYLSFVSYKRLHKGKNVKLRMFQKVSSPEEVFAKAYGDMRKLYDSFYIDDIVLKKILKEILERGLPHIIEVYQILEKKYVDEYLENNEETIIEDSKKEQELKKIEISEKTQELKKTPVLKACARKLVESKRS